MKKILFKIARLNFMGTIVSLIIRFLPYILPVKYIVVCKEYVAFYHPVPSYNEHILIVPRFRMRELINATRIQQEKLAVVFDAIVAGEITHKISNLKIVVNGGARQDVMQVHFHLFELDNMEGIGEKSLESIYAKKTFLNKLTELNCDYSKGSLKNKGYSIIYEKNKLLIDVK